MPPLQGIVLLHVKHESTKKRMKNATSQVFLGDLHFRVGTQGGATPRQLKRRGLDDDRWGKSTIWASKVHSSTLNMQ